MMKNINSNIWGTFSLLAISFASLNVAHAQGDQPPFYHDVPNMIEEAQAAGIDHKYTGPWEYFVGGGVAGFDCNNDRLPDLAIAGGGTSAGLFVNKSSMGSALKFERKGLDINPSQLKKVSGFYPINFNNDAHIDLIAMRVGKNLILEGQGDCDFKVANRALSFDGGRAWTTGFSALWESGQTFPTLAFGNYIDRSAPGSPWGTCEDNILHRPTNADGKVVSYDTPIVLSPGYCSLSVLFTDWNNSGEFGLRITNDRQYYRGGQEQLWSMSQGRLPRQFTKRDGWRRVQIWGMGIAETDLDNDGMPEYALTSMGDTKLQKLDPDSEDLPVYKDIAFSKGTTAHRPYIGDDIKPSTGWHSQFADFNNDGRQDLFIAKGNVSFMPDFAAFDPDNMLLSDKDGQFHEKGGEAGIALNTKGRGGLVIDLNTDGMLDLVVVNREQNVSLFRNQGNKTSWGHRPMGNWIAIELQNGNVNSHAIGAKISIKTGNHTQSKIVQIGGGHSSGQLGFSHFGLGVAERVSIRVKWPDGSWSHPYRVFANNFVVLKRHEEKALYWYPPSQ